MSWDGGVPDRQIGGDVEMDDNWGGSTGWRSVEARAGDGDRILCRACIQFRGGFLVRRGGALVVNLSNVRRVMIGRVLCCAVLY